MVAVVVPPSQATRASRSPSLARAPPGWWRYLERGRTHEVLAEWREAEGIMRLRETSPSAPDARFEEAIRVAKPWEARVALWTIECRLSILGKYWQQRSTDSGWRQLGTPMGAPTPDLRRNSVIDPANAPLVHHYHDPRGGGDLLLAALRGEPSRYAIVRAKLDVPSLDVGRIDVLHPRLADPVMKSIVMREQLSLTQTGLPKLVTRDDYVRAFGGGGERRAARLVDEVLERVRTNQLDRPALRPEDSDVYAEFLVTLHDPKLRALHKRFLLPGEEPRLLAGGPIAIRKAISEKRAQVEHTAQHLLTILEASLLARERLQGGKLARGDPEVRALTRLAYYL